MIHKRNAPADERGTAILEAALVLPFLIALMIGVYDFGRAFETISIAQKSLQTATRYLAILPTKAAICGYGLDRAKNLAVYGNIAGSGPALISGWAIGNISMTAPTSGSCSDSSVTSPPTVIEVQATVPYSPLLLSTFGSTWTFSVKRQERWIGQ